MKIAILGAGFSGLSAGYQLAKKGHEVHIFEKAGLPGGAAGGFKLAHWDWYLDYAYHHSFTSEKNILTLAKEIGYPPFLVRSPITSSLYYSPDKPEKNNNSMFKYLFGENTKSYKLDSPADLLKFDRISLTNRIRTGLVLAFLKFGPKLDYYDKVTAKEFLTLTMGKTAYQELWQPLFEKKFRQHQKDINMGFFWARLRRSSKLTYPVGGYQAFANALAGAVKQVGGQIHYNSEISKLTHNQKTGFSLFSKKNAVIKSEILINTLQTPIFLKLEKNVLPSAYRKRLAKIQYLGAQNIIIESKHKILPKSYWLSLALSPLKNYTYAGLDWMVGVQHTNFIDKKYYHNKNLFYLATYSNSPKQFKITDQKIAKDYKIIQQAFIKYAQPLYTKEFTKVKPNYSTPVPNLYFASMELTYPYDRGTNQAVRCGEMVAKMIK